MGTGQHSSAADGDVSALPLCTHGRDGGQRRTSLSLSSPCPASVLQDILLSKHSLLAGLEGGGERVGNSFRNVEQVHRPP